MDTTSLAIACGGTTLQVLYLLHDMQQHQTYVFAASARVAQQIVTNFDGRRLERLGPGELPDSCLRQNVKLEWL